ncbi:hypothetical protein [Stenotrophomonas sp.]|uniref:hypothetical protein n=1 Tax=Stenotrophomonas sp. TaxID=69392 RepID=UPI0028A15096|nr:hypothetical protein [Stenotrophomonas sp.]
MSADWLDGDISPVVGGSGIAIATVVAAIMLGSTMYHQQDNRICKGFAGLDANSYEYTKKLEQCMADGKSVPGK